MFDTFQGLPVHVLFLHASVVLVPVMALATVAVPLVGRLRARLAWPLVAGNVVTLVAVYITIESGKALQRRMSANLDALAQTHAELGNQMLYVMLALLAVSVLAAVLRERAGTLRIAVAGLSTVAAITACVWIVRVGHSGATSVWQDVIANS